MRLDTVVGMMFSNAVAFCVMLMGGVVLRRVGIADVQTAAQALRPLAGDFAFTLFSLGSIATGLLAVPVLVSSAAHPVAKTFGWPGGSSATGAKRRGFIRSSASPRSSAPGWTSRRSTR